MKYSDKLKDPRWQKKRLELFVQNNWKCTQCGCNHKTLHVHHKKYVKGKDPWEYDNKNLTTLCETCHKKEHEEILDPDRKYEHLILSKETPEVINKEYMKLHELSNKLKENIDSNLQEEILRNIMFIQKQLKERLNQNNNAVIFAHN